MLIVIKCGLQNRTSCLNSIWFGCLLAGLDLQSKSYIIRICNPLFTTVFIRQMYSLVLIFSALQMLIIIRCGLQNRTGCQYLSSKDNIYKVGKSAPQRSRLSRTQFLFLRKGASFPDGAKGCSAGEQASAHNFLSPPLRSKIYILHF